MLCPISIILTFIMVILNGAKNPRQNVNFDFPQKLLKNYEEYKMEAFLNFTDNQLSQLLLCELGVIIFFSIKNPKRNFFPVGFILQ